MKAKKVNLIGKITGAVVILVGGVFVGLGLLPGLSAVEVIYIGLGIMAVFLGIDINLIVEKIFK